MPTGGVNLFGLHQFDFKDSFFSGNAILPQSVGYGIVIGYGALFGALTLAFTFFDHKYGGTKDNSEEFNTAGRSIKTGLVAVDVVSRWTWVVTILLGANEVILYGVAGAFWYSAGSLIEIFLFGILALDLKRKAPKAHTVIELVHLRWGKFASAVYLYLCFLNNVIICALMFIGAGDILAAVTGMNIYVALVLLPVGVVIYAFSGGLKATFISSYLHTIVVFVAVNIFVYTVYSSNHEQLGSIGKVWENLKVVSSVVPVKGNKQGSYMTMFSRLAVEFGVWNNFASLGTMFADQAYWQGAIAATPKAAFHGYLLGGVLWFPIPFVIAMSMGIAALALDLPLSQDEFNQGLITVAVAQYLMGKGGVVLILTIVFMSVTSAGSAEFMSMSSLWTYDIYKRYINPKATSAQLLMVSRASVVCFGLLMGLVACVCKLAGIDVNFLFFVGGFLVSSAFPPLFLMVTWQAVPAGAAIAAALGGQALSIGAWLAHTQLTYGRMTIKDTLQRLGPTLDGTLVAVLSSTIICVFWTLVAPEKGNTFVRWQEIEMMDDVPIPDYDKDDLQPKNIFFNKFSLAAIGLSIVIVVIWPLLTLPAGIFSKGYFTFWVILCMVWATIATIVATFLPLLESRKDLLRIIKTGLGLKPRPAGSEKKTSTLSENA